jgi:hypothetical protein
MIKAANRIPSTSYIEKEKCSSSIRHGIAEFLTPELTPESIPLE